MNKTNFAMIATLALTTIAFSQEKKIQRADLPAAVEKTVAAQRRGATIKGFSMEVEKGQTYYEAEMVVSGHRRDVLMDANGAVVETEEQVALDSLPADVKEGLQTKAGAGKIVKVESITKQDKLVAYEAVVQTGSKKKEIQVGPNGQSLAHEE